MLFVLQLYCITVFYSTMGTTSSIGKDVILMTMSLKFLCLNYANSRHVPTANAKMVIFAHGNHTYTWSLK